MGVAAAGKELFRQRDGRSIGASGFARLVQRARSGRQNFCAPEWLFQPNRRGSSEHKLMSSLTFAAERLIGGVLRQSPAKVGVHVAHRRFRAGTKVTRCRKRVEREIVPFRTLQRIVPLVSDEGKTR